MSRKKNFLATFWQSRRNTFPLAKCNEDSSLKGELAWTDGRKEGRKEGAATSGERCVHRETIRGTQIFNEEFISGVWVRGHRDDSPRRRRLLCLSSSLFLHIEREAPSLSLSLSLPLCSLLQALPPSPRRLVFRLIFARSIFWRRVEQFVCRAAFQFTFKLVAYGVLSSRQESKCSRERNTARVRASGAEGQREGVGQRESMYRVTPRVRGTERREEEEEEEEAGGEGTSSWSNSQILKRPREERRRVPRAEFIAPWRRRTAPRFCARHVNACAHSGDVSSSWGNVFEKIRDRGVKVEIERFSRILQDSFLLRPDFFLLFFRFFSRYATIKGSRVRYSLYNDSVVPWNDGIST